MASSDTRLFRESAAGASWAFGLAGWLAGKGVSGVVAHASSNKVALQRIRHKVWFIGSINGLIFIFGGRHLTRSAELRHGEQVREPGQCSHLSATHYYRRYRGGNARSNCSFRPFQKGLLWQRRSSRHHVANPGRAVGTIHVFAEPVTVRLMSDYGVKRTHSPCVKRYSLKNPSEKFRYFAAVALKDSKV